MSKAVLNLVDFFMSLGFLCPAKVTNVDSGKCANHFKGQQHKLQFKRTFTSDKSNRLFYTTTTKFQHSS